MTKQQAKWIDVHAYWFKRFREEGFSVGEASRRADLMANERVKP